jgi:D-amino-acid dehydrogenase
LRLIVVGSGIAEASSRRRRGVVGASCAYAASSLGAEVVLVDAAKPGRATAAGAGIICPWSAQVADPAWCALAYAAAREYLG